MRYEDIIFVHGDEALEGFTLLDLHGVKSAFVFLKSLYRPGRHSVLEENPAALTDDSYRDGDFIMSWSRRYKYIGLVRELVE